jgi:phage tail sheath protein FI
MEALTLRGVLIMRPGSSGGGTRTWGARTMGSDVDPPFRYISVRRTLDLVSESLRKGMPTDDCATAAPPAETFLLDMWRDGALQGSSTEEAFYVRCDRPGDPLQIGIAVLRPTEFVHLRIELGTGT